MSLSHSTYGRCHCCDNDIYRCVMSLLWQWQLPLCGNSRSTRFPDESFEWRRLHLLIWKLVGNFRDTRQNLVDMYGDSRENMLENLAFGIVLSPISSVCKALQGGDPPSVKHYRVAMSCRSFVAKETLIIRLYCGKWPMKTRHRHPVGCFKLQVIFRNGATNYRALLREMTYGDKASHDSCS